jgi:cytochrome bd-type quinol oxidase subunit 2
MSDQPVKVNKPLGPSPTANQESTVNTKDLDERLGELRSDLLSQRQNHRRVVVNAIAAMLALVAIGGEVSAIATGLVAHRKDAVAVLFAISAAAALVGTVLAVIHVNAEDKQRPLVDAWCMTALTLAASTAVGGAFVAAWPP